MTDRTEYGIAPQEVLLYIKDEALKILLLQSRTSGSCGAGYTLRNGENYEYG